MKPFGVLILAFILCISSSLAVAQEPRVLSDVSVVYELSVKSESSGNAAGLSGAVKNVYVKGSKLRTELITSSFKQVLINDAKSDSTVLLREIGNTKYLSYLDRNKVLQQNSQFSGITFIPTNETKVILGYNCEKVIARLQNGTEYNVYYAPSIVPANRAYEFQFLNLPGFALEYEAQSVDGKTIVKYEATKITLTPVPAALFDVPKSGYRVL